MQKNSFIRFLPLFISLVVILGCSTKVSDLLPGQAPATPQPVVVEVPATQPVMPTEKPQEVAATAEPVAVATDAPTELPPAPTIEIVHLVTPDAVALTGPIIYDVTSEDTAPENRAPYGDSYNINRFERPFDQDMQYNPNLDIVTYNLVKDKTWNYVSIELIGTDPNDPLGIQYEVEIDTNIDGFGDYIIVAVPPFTPRWETTNVMVYRDTNRDTGGLSGEKSDAPFEGDGYDSLIFDRGIGDDPDLAWVRINAGRRATVQIAFKQSLSGKAFMIGTVADAGFKDVGMMDYVDRFTRAEAGSPVRDNKDYPLKLLYNIDNACRSGYGFAPTGYEPQLCPRDEPTPHPRSTPSVCQAPSYCYGTWYEWDPVNCICNVILY